MSVSGAGETKVDGKAHKEGDEVRRIILLMLRSNYAFCKLVNLFF